MEEKYLTPFSGIIEKAKQNTKPMRVAIAGADAENILRGAFEAEKQGFVEPILIGNFEKIREMVTKLGYDHEKYDIQPVNDGTSPVQYAIDMINAGKADCIMRGNTQTRDFLLPVLHKSNKLMKENKVVSHVVVLHVPEYKKNLAISDVTLLVNPDLRQRRCVARNIVRVLNVAGHKHPNIALLSLVETPSFQMRDTVEAQTLVKEHKETPIADCELVGPIPYDLIMSKEAARLKGYDCPFCGDFDGIVAPNLLAGNLMVKILEHNADATGYGVLVGAKVPIAISSRSDSVEHSFLSLAACAAMLVDRSWDL
ncbi:MAG: phosphate acyltransferase [Bacillota bacterium]|nr:phosphate acyltransferase [Bacillota bacterium]